MKRRLALLVVATLGLSACGTDTSHPSYQDGYTAGISLARQLGISPAAGPASCDELTKMSALTGGPVGGDYNLAYQGCVEGVADS